MTNILIYLLTFLTFAVLQALFINGVYTSLKGNALKDDITGKITYQGMVLYMIAPKFFEKYKHRWWSSPTYNCIKCMASFWGALTYWPTVIYFLGFRVVEIPIFIADVFILVYLNFYFYQKA